LLVLRRSRLKLSDIRRNEDKHFLHRLALALVAEDVPAAGDVLRPGTPALTSVPFSLVRPEMTTVSPLRMMRVVSVCFLMMKGLPSTEREVSPRPS